MTVITTAAAAMGICAERRNGSCGRERRTIRATALPGPPAPSAPTGALSPAR